MKRAALSPEDQVRSIHFKYEIPEDRVQAALDRGFRFGDVDQAALLYCLSDASMEDILAMRKDDPWGVIKKKLGLTAAVYEKTYLLHRAERLERFYGISAQRALTLLEEGYPNHWIRLDCRNEESLPGEEEVSWRHLDKPQWGLRVQAPFGAVGIGTGAVLSRIPEG